MMRTFIILFLGLLLADFGCREKITPPLIEEKSTWKVVPELASLDVRYMIQHNGVLFLAAVDPVVTQTNCDTNKCYYVGDRSVVYKTTDAITWAKIKGFNVTIGPMTFHEDTLYCLTDYDIYRMLPSGEWQAAFPTPPRLEDASADGDIVFIRDTLYAMQTFFGNAVETYRIHPNGLFEEVPGFDGIAHYAGAKYIKYDNNGEEIIYLRPQWNAGGFFKFDGYVYTKLENGLTPEELGSSPSNALAIKNDTLYSAFGGAVTPGVIKALINNQWQRLYDTIPYWRLAYEVTPTLRAQPTAIVFAGERIFVATNSTGVIKWEVDSGWIPISDGLIHGVIPGIDNKDLYSPLPFLEYFNNRLIAAYGKPGYAPWGGVGVFMYDLK